MAITDTLDEQLFDHQRNTLCLPASGGPLCTLPSFLAPCAPSSRRVARQSRQRRGPPLAGRLRRRPVGWPAPPALTTASSTPGFWQLERFADGPPDQLRLSPLGQGLRRGPVAEAGQNLVLGHAVGVGLAELRAHPVPEHGKTHRATLPAPGATHPPRPPGPDPGRPRAGPDGLPPRRRRGPAGTGA